MSAHTEALTDAAIDAQLDAILRASGSALRHYSLPKSINDMRAALRSAVAALALPDAPALPSAAPVVPQGWKLVPVEPTPEMLNANGQCPIALGQRFLHDDARNTWAAMLAAAPPAPQQGEQG